MIKIPFSQLNLTPKVERAIAKMGFDFATQVQSEAIPLIRMREALKTEPHDLYTALTDQLAESGYSYRDIAAAALQLHFAVDVTAASI